MAGQVYVHHYVSSTTFLLGSGAELRGQMTRQPVRVRMAALHGLMQFMATRCRMCHHVSVIMFASKFA